MKNLFGITSALLILFNAVSPVHAVYNPLEVPNNRFGIHITDTNDLEDARNLINSQNGDWGYVTIVMQENDRDYSKWQDFFDICREKHIIPLVRLATTPNGSFWKKPAPGDAPAWANFLNSLNWPIKNKYVILFNEPNHAKEWGGQIDPKGYAEVVEAFSKKLKEEDEDFFILNAGLDASAPEGKDTISEERFLQDMLANKPHIFESIDGWNSHSYPNPGFSSSPQKRGKGSVSTYLWEEEFLNQLGIEKRFPIFITETGWSEKLLSEIQIAQNIELAYQTIWNNRNIIAVTPFILNYQDGLFSEFSWKMGEQFKGQYKAVQAFSKTKGEPIQKEDPILNIELPETLLVNKNYVLPFKLDNKGQAIWKKEEGYVLRVEGADLKVEPGEMEVNTRPGEALNAELKVRTPKNPGEYTIKVVLEKNNKITLERTQNITVGKKEIEQPTPPKKTFRSLARKILKGILLIHAYL
ncbi:MAG: hypothetical protein A3A62_02550 [Candidatus Blackburnbacteria bacterium RIFCSPLOWO2_01_FULL_44_43]|nr:MAG: hypothetical protein A3A62_02550 [Candidatus Blackburnbacteria bacterium RIFCSPLOWO2_01_FULL_44_43]